MLCCCDSFDSLLMIFSRTVHVLDTFDQENCEFRDFALLGVEYCNFHEY